MSTNFSEEKIGNIVIGSGAAGLCAALRLRDKGEEIAIITENLKAGTSRNTGSDKQTYYKLSLAGDNEDSVMEMAKDFFSGGAVDGDMALCEAALSARCFYNLVELGVPFPDNEYGEFMGYRTDHDEKGRATSAGPYTSKIITECLERAVKERNIRIIDHHLAIRLLTHDKKIYGVLCLDTRKKNGTEFKIVWCENVILATGGPAGMYRDSVYPASQIGSSGMAFRAGVKGKNLTEWQFGMASLKPRWNVSGTYMQALPTFISTDAEGGDEREFLNEYFDKPEEMLSKIFLKGYQWPFDVNKINGGSSAIDLMIFLETIVKKRRVFLDYRRNAGGKPIPYEKLDKEAYSYLKNASALLELPYDRLKRMNEPAIEFYLDHGIDLSREMIEIAICAQHNNGGLSTDEWWETDIEGLFAIGEVNGSHGVTRPGGAALNAGQVGAVRAAEKIHMRKSIKAMVNKKGHGGMVAEACEVDNLDSIKARLREEAEKYGGMPGRAQGNRKLNELWLDAASRMSAAAGMIRDTRKLSRAVSEVKEDIDNFTELVECPDEEHYPLFFRLYDMLTSQFVYMSAMRYFAYGKFGSRGSALYTDEYGFKWEKWMPELFRCYLDLKIHDSMVQEVSLEADSEGRSNVIEIIRPVRDIPHVDNTFEIQWKNFRERTKV